VFKNISWSRLSFLFLVLTLSGQAQTDELAQAFERGAAAFQRGQYEQALFEYRAALQWPGDHQARAHFNIGVQARHIGVRPMRATARMRQPPTPWESPCKTNDNFAKHARPLPRR
jgi:hypothetical protein